MIMIQAFIRHLASKKRADKLKKKKIYRENIINELVSTEVQYIKHIDILINVDTFSSF